MRIVRFVTSVESAPRWGMLTTGSEGEMVTPLADAPYRTVDAAGAYQAVADGAPIPLWQVTMLPPVQPSKILCVGRNYAAHAAELGNTVPTSPLIFLKPPSSLIASGDEVVYPKISQRVDYEGELAVIIGKRCKHVAEADAQDVIFGYAVANDVTARDLQKVEDQWARAKGCDTFGPIGPWVDTDFSPSNRRIRTLVNDEVRQDSNTDLMVYSIGRVIAHITAGITLEAGDLILTGTPAGISPVQPGDVMTVEVEGLGSISNPVVAE